MADRRYRPVNFGFLNTAQDSTDIGEFESPNATNLDPDELALGALKHQQFEADTKTLRDFQETSFAGRRFFLGEPDLFTSYVDGQDYRSVELISVRHDLPYAIVLRVRVSSDGFICGNRTFAGTETFVGTFHFQVDGGALKFFRYDGAAYSSITLDPAIATGVWHDVVIAQTGTVATAYLNGQQAGTMALAGLVTGLNGFQFSFGYASDITGCTCDVSEFAIVAGAPETPWAWTGSADRGKLRSLGIADPVIIFATRDGSGVDNFQGLEFAPVGSAPTTTLTENKGEDKLYAEVSDAPRTVVHPAFTTLESADDGGGGTTLRHRITDTDIELPTNNCYVAFDFRLNSYTGSKTIDALGFWDGAATAGISTRFAFGTNTLEVLIRTSAGTTTPEVLPSVEAGRTYRVVLAFEDVSTVSNSRYRFEAFVDGKIEAFYETSNSLDILGISEALLQGDFALPAGGPYSATYTMKNVVVGGNWNTNIPRRQLGEWDGSVEFFSDVSDVKFSTENGDFDANDQGISTSVPSGSAPLVATGGSSVVATQTLDAVADDEGPTVPQVLQTSVEEFLEIDDGQLASASPTSGTPAFNPKLTVIEGRAYNGPEDATIVFGSIEVLTSSFSTVNRNIAVTYRVDGQSGFPNVVSLLTNTGTIKLNHYNLQLSVDIDNTHTFTAGYTCQVKSPTLLDGKYQYRAVAVRESDTSPKVQIESTPSDIADINLNNLDAAGQRVANNIPVITIPPAAPGYPDYVDRVDLYRKDPDSDEFVKIFEHSQVSAYPFRDNSLITELPRIEFLQTESDETFTTINEAIGNTSGNYSLLLDKDNRLWTVPSDRKDLLLYSRENDWWGWKRENSFSFTGDVIDAVPIRDINVVNGESTLVVFTTKGIYHIVGSGTPDSPYTRVPMFGGDDQSNIDMYQGSALPFNGSIFFLAKSSDGLYETGAYGQKVYEYNLQQLTELSGRIKKTSTLNGDGVTGETNEMEYASLIGGDKYVMKKLTNDTCLVYHKDARGWMTYSSVLTDPDNRWIWTSKTFDRMARERGTIADATRLKIDYKGDLKIRLYTYTSDVEYLFQAPNGIELSSASRTIWENMLPATMGEQWKFQLEGTPDTEVYNMWFS